MEVDFKRFNNAGPQEQAALIVAAGCKARGRPVPQPDRPEIDANDPQALAAMIIRAGQRRRGESP
jgi:hypothetical protein